MRRRFTAYSLLALAACGRTPDTPSPPANEPDLAPSNTAQNDSGTARQNVSSLAEADQERVCRTAIADMNGHPPRIVSVVNSSGGIVRVAYTRPSDGRVWTNECRIEGDRVIWRTVDAFGPGSGLGRWRTHPLDEVFTYSIAGDRVSITTTFPGEPPSTETYTVR